MVYPATKNRLGGRLAVAQLVGTVFGVLIIALAGPEPISVSWWEGLSLLLIGALSFGIPAYALAVLVLHIFTRSILHRPFVWCIAVPGALFALSLLAPAPPNSVHWLSAMAFCAVLAGVVFLVWQLRRPMTLSE
ncbi:MAG: hypothetical protein ABIQ32_01260 [Sphingomicrobium sp.]